MPRMDHASSAIATASFGRASELAIRTGPRRAGGDLATAARAVPSHGAPALVALFRRAGYVTDSAPMPETDLVICQGEPADLSSPGIARSADRAVAPPVPAGPDLYCRRHQFPPRGC
jgi:hypothetical protein